MTALCYCRPRPRDRQRQAPRSAQYPRHHPVTLPHLSVLISRSRWKVDGNPGRGGAFRPVGREAAVRRSGRGGWAGWAVVGVSGARALSVRVSPHRRRDVGRASSPPRSCNSAPILAHALKGRKCQFGGIF